MMISEPKNVNSLLSKVLPPLNVLSKAFGEVGKSEELVAPRIYSSFFAFTMILCGVSFPVPPR